MVSERPRATRGIGETSGCALGAPPATKRRSVSDITRSISCRLKNKVFPERCAHDVIDTTFPTDDGFLGRFARYGRKETARRFAPDLSQTVKADGLYEALMRESPEAGLAPGQRRLISGVSSPPLGELLRCNKKEP